MRIRRPLPPPLLGKTFTRQEARALGISDRRLMAPDVERLSRGVYRCLQAPVLSPEEDTDQLRSFQRMVPGTWYSHTTAAGLYRLPTGERKLVGPSPIHISALYSTSLAKLPNVVVHRPMKVGDTEVIDLNGIQVSSPERTFLELAVIIPVPALIAAGDQLVRIPKKAYESRGYPWTSISALRDFVSAHPHTPGVPAAKDALRLIRVGADSAPETQLRLAIIDMGLPEPALQVPAWPGCRYTADLGYPEVKIALQYEGVHHFTPEQQAADQRRNAAFEAAGWTVIMVNRVDLRQNFGPVIRRLAQLLADRGAIERS